MEWSPAVHIQLLNHLQVLLRALQGCMLPHLPRYALRIATAPSRATCLQEVAIMRKVRHKNIVQFIGACTQKPNLCIVFEFMSGGSVYDYIRKVSAACLAGARLLLLVATCCFRWQASGAAADVEGLCVDLTRVPHAALLQPVPSGPLRGCTCLRVAVAVGRGTPANRRARVPRSSARTPCTYSRTSFRR